jgi:hypothetical protein
MRFLIHWALRREELCDPGLCPDAPDEGGRCDHCPLDKLDASRSSTMGLLATRALNLRSVLSLGLSIALDDVMADEFATLLLLEEEISRREARKASL